MDIEDFFKEVLYINDIFKNQFLTNDDGTNTYHIIYDLDKFPAVFESWRSKVVFKESDCNVKYEWSSIENLQTINLIVKSPDKKMTMIKKYILK